MITMKMPCHKRTLSLYQGINTIKAFLKLQKFEIASHTVKPFETHPLTVSLCVWSRKLPKHIIITSVRQSSASGDWRFGKQYIVDSVNSSGVNIQYEHEGSGDTVIPKVVSDTL